MAQPNVQTTDEAPETTESAKTASSEAAEETENPKPGLKGESDSVKPIKLEIFRSGWTQEGDYPDWGIEGRAFDQSYVRALAENTTRMMKDCGLKVPIVLNHPTGWTGDEQREAAEGWVLGLEVRELEEKDPQGNPELVLIGECIMEGALKDDFDAGRLPKRSIGWSSEGKLPNGRLIGPFLQHLGLLGGRSQPAIPGLNDLPLAASVHVPKGFNGAFYDPSAWSQSRASAAELRTTKRSAVQTLKSFINGVTQKIGSLVSKLQTSASQTAAETENTMSIEEIKEALAGVSEYFTAGMAAMEEMIASLGEEEEVEGDEEIEDEEPSATEDEEPKAEDKDPDEEARAKKQARKLTPSEIKLQQQLAAKEKENETLKMAHAETRFAELATQGRVAASAKDKFLKVAKAEGVATAEDYFAGEPIQRPPMGRVLGTPATGQGTPAEIEAIKTRAMQIANEYGTSTKSYAAEKARALTLDKTLEPFFAEIEAPLAKVNAPSQGE